MNNERLSECRTSNRDRRKLTPRNSLRRKSKKLNKQNINSGIISNKPGS